MQRQPLRILIIILTAATAFTAIGDWKTEANERIEQLRKRDALVRIVDAAGRPVENADLRILQTSKAFPFGAAVSAAMINNTQYQQFFLDHFNYAVFENESKWYANEGRRGFENYREADALLTFLDEHNIPVRGHCVFWAPAKWQPQWLQQLADADEIRQETEDRATNAVTHFKNRFVSWDVNNEMIHGSFFLDHLGPGIRKWMFDRTHELDPNAKLFVNEYNVLSVDENFQEVETEQYIQQTQDLIDQGARIEGVGVQGHIWQSDVFKEPELLKQRLDRMASLGLPIWISEFDTADPQEDINAENLEAVYRIAYSHPAVEGIMMWVVWAGNSWRGPNAGIAKQDWSLNAAGERYQALMDEWTTDTSGSTNADGSLAFRGFHGGYEITVKSPDGTETTKQVQLQPGEGTESIVIEIP